MGFFLFFHATNTQRSPYPSPPSTPPLIPSTYTRSLHRRLIFSPPFFTHLWIQLLLLPLLLSSLPLIPGHSTSVSSLLHPSSPTHELNSFPSFFLESQRMLFHLQFALSLYNWNPCHSRGWLPPSHLLTSRPSSVFPLSSLPLLAPPPSSWQCKVTPVLASCWVWCHGVSTSIAFLCGYY